MASCRDVTLSALESAEMFCCGGEIMARMGCDSINCQYKAMGVGEHLVLAFVAAGAVSIVPLSSALNIDLSQAITSAKVVVRGSAIFPALGWIAALYFAWKEPTNHYWTAIFNAMGVPGAVLALTMYISFALG